jgi:V/A-type H+-transporting ATPase subunit C
MQYLNEKGWGDGTGSMDAASMFAREEEKTWEVVRDIAPDLSVFDVLSYPKLYHNLKAAIKELCTEISYEGIFYDDCSIPGKEMLSIIQNKEYGRLPGNMGEAAKEAHDTLLHTRDGQLCDVIIDRAALDAIYEAGKKAEDEIIKNYAESTVAIADIKIAVRCQKTGKSVEFMKRAMAPCDTINVEHLARVAAGGVDAIREYLAGTIYAEGARALEESPSAFERWCDNRMMETIKPQKYNAFSVGPLVAYVLARENEIKTVRIILTGKQNGFSDEVIRERIREMYV